MVERLPWFNALWPSRSAIADVLPKIIRERWKQDPCVVRLLCSDQQLALLPGPGSDNAIEFLASFEDVARRLETYRRRWGSLLSVHLVVDCARCLIREVDLPKAARAQWDEMLLFDVEQSTPFQRHSILSGWRHEGCGQTRELDRLTQVVLKKSVIEPYLQLLASVNVAATAVDVINVGAEDHPIRMGHGLARSPTPVTKARSVAAYAGALAGTAVLMLYAATLWRQSQLLEQLDAEMQRLNADVARVRKTMTEADSALFRAQRVRFRKLETVPVVEVWEEVTRLLPETAWIHDLRIDETAIVIDGFASTASELVSLFARSALFREVGFASPVTRDPQRGLERFQLKMSLAVPGVAPMSKAGPT